MATHQAVLVDSTGGPLQLRDLETRSPDRDHIRIDVAACGVCGTDRAIVNGAFPSVSFPLTPGHEIAGTVAEVGEGVDNFSIGDRVAVGWFGGHCNHCIPCRKGLFIHCENMQVPSVQYPGGYAQSVIVPANAAAGIPDALSYAEAAPMGCAGVTTYNALRGQLVIVGVAAEPLPISPAQLIMPALSVSGHPSGTARDVEETMDFAVLSGVRARIEERPLAEAADAYAAMEQGRARYRMVLTM